MKKKESSIISKHVLVPLHEVLTEREAKEVLKRFHTDKEKLPKIRVDDPALRGMNVKKGDIIKITRRSPVSGKAISYRVVIE